MNDMCGIRLTPFQGLDFCYTRFTGRCPVLLLMPFQGKKEDNLKQFGNSKIVILPQKHNFIEYF